ncbi:MAG: response regulator transcription factor [Sulfuricella sp.]|nr:response regulator transcription factor [Sulfuricella sp.]
MGESTHYFISEKGDLLPRWQEAFPGAGGFRLGEAAFAGKPPSLIWLHLSPARTAADSLAEVRAKLGDAPCIVLSDTPGDEEGLACFAAGARGYCNTHAVPEALRQVADVVLQGGLWIGESLMQRLLQATSRIPPKAPAQTWGATLTEREREVAQAVACGESNKGVARQLGITERTVKAHVGAILEKLEVPDRLRLSLIVNGHRSS